LLSSIIIHLIRIIIRITKESRIPLAPKNPVLNSKRVGEWERERERERERRVSPSVSLLAQQTTVCTSRPASVHRYETDGAAFDLLDRRESDEEAPPHSMMKR
jgi:hypothetical protein